MPTSPSFRRYGFRESGAVCHHLPGNVGYRGVKECSCHCVHREIVRLQDVADVHTKEEKRGGISRYDGAETISISVMKNQSNTDIEVSRAVRETIQELQDADPDLTAEVVNDTADTILESLKDVAETMVLSVIISMIIISCFWRFKSFSDCRKLHPHVDSAVSDCHNRGRLFAECHYHERLVLGVGMMVDNSIVVLESCFRAAELNRDKGIFGYAKAALLGSNQVLAPLSEVLPLPA